MKNHISICAAIVILFSSYTMAGTWTTIDVPTTWGSDTQVFGISGNRIVGVYVNSAGQHSFLYDGSNWANIDVPGATTTFARGIYGNHVVGTYETYITPNYSFLYDGTNWTTLSKSGSEGGIIANGIYGNNIVGSYGTQGFICDGINWTTIGKPGATSTYFCGIYENDIVGGYFDAANQYHSFLYNQGSWTDLPNNPWVSSATVAGISGNYIVSSYSVFQPGGFGILYDGTNWTKLQMAGAIYTNVYGIDGDKIVGSYMLSDNQIHGFIYTIPEPATLLLLGLGAVMLGRKRS